MNHFYVLKSLKDERYYYGSTDDLDRRLKEHLAGRVNSTKYRRPLTLVYRELFDTIEQARARERHVKHSASEREKIKSQIQDQHKGE